MTIAEVDRAVASKNRIKRQEEKERASFDYILASIIARGVQAAVVGGEGIPDITEVYGGLFEDDLREKNIKKQNLKNELSALRFKEYANFHNKKLNREVANINE